MKTKFIVVRHGTHRNLSNEAVSVNVLTCSGIHEAQKLLEKLKALLPDGEMDRQVRVYSSPSTRAVQTAEILAGGKDIILAQEINESYMGVPQFVKTLQELPQGIFDVVLIVTHAPPVGRIAAALAGDEYKDDDSSSPYFYGRIKNCEGFLIEGSIATKI